MSFIRWSLFLVYFLGSSAEAFTLAGGNSNLRGWKKRELKFRYNVAECSVSRTKILEAIEAAMDAWNGAPTSRIKLVVGEEDTSLVSTLHSDFDGSEKNPVIFCDANFGSYTRLDPNTVYGSGSIGARDDQIIWGSLRLNSQGGAKADISNMNADTLRIAIAHELGHVLGLGHSDELSALMYFSLEGKEDLRLSQDDVDGVSYLYPRHEIFGDGLMGCGTLKSQSSRNDLNNMNQLFVIIGFIFILWVAMRGIFALRPRVVGVATVLADFGLEVFR